MTIHCESCSGGSGLLIHSSLFSREELEADTMRQLKSVTQTLLMTLLSSQTVLQKAHEFFTTTSLEFATSSVSLYLDDGKGST
jgi:hypothetical protein